MLLEYGYKVIITLLVTTFNNCKLSSATELRHVFCYKDFITVHLPVTSNHSNLFIKSVYWKNLHTNERKECQPVYHDHEITFMILFENLLKCGFERSLNKWKQQITYQQNLIVEQNRNITMNINVKCSYKIKICRNPTLKHKIIKRSTLPADFQEDEDIEIIESLEQTAIEPNVSMKVRQNGEIIDGMVTVIPGTPLIMEIKLNEMASQVYDIKVNYLEVTDRAIMSETILFKGCTVDPYLFENFNNSKNNSLQAKFRAFKFPNTAFVQFRANVQICLNKCQAVQCIGGSDKKQQSRKRRELVKQKENLFETRTSFILKVQENFKGNPAEFQSLQNHINLLHIKNLQLQNLNHQKRNHKF